MPRDADPNRRLRFLIAGSEVLQALDQKSASDLDARRLAERAMVGEVQVANQGRRTGKAPQRRVVGGVRREQPDPGAGDDPGADRERRPQPYPHLGSGQVAAEPHRVRRAGQLFVQRHEVDGSFRLGTASSRDGQHSATGIWFLP